MCVPGREIKWSCDVNRAMMVTFDWMARKGSGYYSDRMT